MKKIVMAALAVIVVLGLAGCNNPAGDNGDIITWPPGLEDLSGTSVFLPELSYNNTVTEMVQDGEWKMTQTRYGENVRDKLTMYGEMVPTYEARPGVMVTEEVKKGTMYPMVSEMYALWIDKVTKWGEMVQDYEPIDGHTVKKVQKLGHYTTNNAWTTKDALWARYNSSGSTYRNYIQYSALTNSTSSTISTSSSTKMLLVKNNVSSSSGSDVLGAVYLTRNSSSSGSGNNKKYTYTLRVRVDLTGANSSNTVGNVKLGDIIIYTSSSAPSSNTTLPGGTSSQTQLTKLSLTSGSTSSNITLLSNSSSSSAPSTYLLIGASSLEYTSTKGAWVEGGGTEPMVFDLLSSEWYWTEGEGKDFEGTTDYPVSKDFPVGEEYWAEIPGGTVEKIFPVDPPYWEQCSPDAPGAVHLVEQTGEYWVEDPSGTVEITVTLDEPYWKEDPLGTVNKMVQTGQHWEAVVGGTIPVQIDDPVVEHTHWVERAGWTASTAGAVPFEWPLPPGSDPIFVPNGVPYEVTSYKPYQEHDIEIAGITLGQIILDNYKEDEEDTSGTLGISIYLGEYTELLDAIYVGVFDSQAAITEDEADYVKAQDFYHEIPDYEDGSTVWLVFRGDFK